MSIAWVNRGDGERAGLQRTQPETPFGIGVHTEHGERISVLAAAKRNNLLFAEHAQAFFNSGPMFQVSIA